MMSWRTSTLLVLVVTTASIALSRASDLRQLRFSSDGHHVLAQNDSEIVVLTVQPFAVQYRIPVLNADFVQFTPDSRQIVFISNDAQKEPRQHVLASAVSHVELWSIADRARIRATAIPLQNCETLELSPDGRTVACVTFEGTLQVIDVPTGKTFFEKKEFGQQWTLWDNPPTNPFPVRGGDIGLAMMDFSADGRFLVAATLSSNRSSVGVNVEERTPITLVANLRLHEGWTVQNFTFVNNTRLMTSSSATNPSTAHAKLAEFPSGRILSRLRLPPGRLFRAADPHFVLIRPFGKNVRYDDVNAKRAAAVEYNTGQVIVSETRPLDVFGSYYIAERPNGEVGLYERGKGLRAAISLQAH